MSEVSKGTPQVLADEQLTLYEYLLCAIYWRLISCCKIQTPKCTLLWHDKVSLSTCLDLRPYFDSHEKQEHGRNKWIYIFQVMLKELLKLGKGQGEDWWYLMDCCFCFCSMGGQQPATPSSPRNTEDYEMDAQPSENPGYISLFFEVSSGSKDPKET